MGQRAFVVQVSIPKAGAVGFPRRSGPDRIAELDQAIVLEPRCQNASAACLRVRIGDTLLTATQAALCAESVFGLENANTLASHVALSEELLGELCPEVSNPDVTEFAEKLALPASEVTRICPALVDADG